MTLYPIGCVFNRARCWKKLILALAALFFKSYFEEGDRPSKIQSQCSEAVGMSIMNLAHLLKARAESNLTVSCRKSKHSREGWRDLYQGGQDSAPASRLRPGIPEGTGRLCWQLFLLAKESCPSTLPQILAVIPFNSFAIFTTHGCVLQAKRYAPRHTCPSEILQGW
jgi:hypothetical protein